MKNNPNIAVIGLGYVGLSAAVAFGRSYDTVAFDIDRERVAQCRGGNDLTGEVDSAALRGSRYLRFGIDVRECSGADFLIVAVPTPVDDARRPDFSALIGACELVGGVLKRGAVVIFESTVYPGATEEVCVPALEAASGLVWKRDFHVAYSPERVNPGDRDHTFETIVKLVAADDATTRTAVAELYRSVVPAGVHEVESIPVAEAAKVIENTQRDLNIALVNEWAIIFDRLGLDTLRVLEAAGTKWNFLPFRPGLVGGHCIGVDPYYLTHKAQMLGYHPEVILAGRRINDGMGRFVAERTVKTMLDAGVELQGARVNVLGITFKENCPDMRNSQVFSVIDELRAYGLTVEIHDPVADRDYARQQYGVQLCGWSDLPPADAVMLAVAHDALVARRPVDYLEKLRRPGAVIDVKSALSAEAFSRQDVAFWRL